VHPGLPPGPIGNPGLASIEAAAHPAETDYIFYVAAVCGNGRHRFASTDAQFQRYVDAYERAREERGGRSPTRCG
jgi:cell division protein YceG involved in septum cleavage